METTLANYKTIEEVASEWGVTTRMVHYYCNDGRISGAMKVSRIWMIPADAEKPSDPRCEKKSEKSLSSDLADIIAATTLPMPRDNPDAIIKTTSNERFRLHYESELAYLRGDFEFVKQCFLKTEGDDASRLRACSVTIAAAISTGDYPFYLDIERFLTGFIKPDAHNEPSSFAELCLSSAYTGARAPNMVPDWLKNGDFTFLFPQAKPDAIYKRVKYFQCLGKFESMLAAAETALEFCASASGITFHDIYFRVMCAVACFGLHRIDEAKRWLLDAMGMALPHGFITPFAELLTIFGGLLEQLLTRKYPAFYDAVVGQWNRTFTNWLLFHNRFTKENITLILSLREYQMALLAARGVPNAEIAAQFHISVGRLKSVMHEIYGKLFITKRRELAKYIL